MSDFEFYLDGLFYEIVLDGAILGKIASFGDSVL